MRERPPKAEGEPIPSPVLAFGVTAAAMMLLLFAAQLFLPMGQAVAIGIGAVLALGGLGTLLGRYVPAPAEERLGLSPVSARWLGIVVLLLPVVLWTSELDNWILAYAPALPAQTDPVEAPSPLAQVEFALVFALLLPILEEFFFRGGLLQGVAKSMRPFAACMFVAVLWALWRVPIGGPPERMPSVLAISIVEGLLLGVLRLASGSILPAIALRIAMAVSGLLLITYKDVVPIPGFNQMDHAHTPIEWLLAAALPLGIGLTLLRRAWLEREPLPAIPPPDEEDESDYGFF